ncbi:MAG: outer membrane protein assembly factor BamB [Stenotrophobium sp.]
MKTLRLALLVLVAVSVGACSSDKNVRKPAALQDIANPALKITKLWSSSAGDGSDTLYTGLQMSVQPDAVFAADVGGDVYAFNPKNGDRIWRAKTGARVISGPSVSGNLLLVGTLDAQVIALKRADGSELWHSTLSSEVLAVSAGNGDIVVARTVDGHVYGLAADTGKQIWNFDRNEPNLTLRGLSEPMVIGGSAYVGLDNGRMVSLRVTDGQLNWEQVVAVPSGRTELDRITDIDAGLLDQNGNIFAASFGGELAAVDATSGQVQWRRAVKSYTGMVSTGKLIVVTDESGVVWALDAATGAAAWKQKDLLYRKLSPPAMLDGNIVVGDYEGYLSWLNPTDGSIIARSRAGSDPIRAHMAVMDDVLYVMNSTGKITALSIKPR